MREDETEICTLTWDGVLEAPYSGQFTWRDAVRHRNAVTLLARQLAFKDGEAIDFELHGQQLRARRLRRCVGFIIARGLAFSRLTHV